MSDSGKKRGSKGDKKGKKVTVKEIEDGDDDKPFSMEDILALGGEKDENKRFWEAYETSAILKWNHKIKRATRKCEL